jgi:tripartite-type tricarboxylate transporter receptor subunit TctC
MSSVMADPKVIKTLRDASYEPASATADEIRARIRSDYERTGAFLRAHNIRLE